VSNSSFNFWFCFVSSVVTMAHNVGNVSLWSGCVKLWLCIYIRVFFKVTLSSTCLWASFHPLSLSLGEVHKVRKEVLFNLGMKCWNSAFNAHKVRGTIIVVVRTGRISENICSSSGGAQEKGKTGWNSVYQTKMVHF
jgi:hypothetical protein